MNAHNFESTTLVETNSQSEQTLAETLAGGTVQVQRETQGLIDAIKRRAQIQAKSPSALIREYYLQDVCRARAAIASPHINNHSSLVDSWLVMQQEAKRNWYLLTKEVIDLSHRCQKAARAAWFEFNRV
jgi:hypothetical protein